VKASKKLQKQFADFKLEFAAICQEFGGTPDKHELSGPDSAFLIPTAWGNIRASISEPWGMDMELYAGHRQWTSAGIFLCAQDYGDTLPDCWHGPGLGGWRHWKWNIHRSMDVGGTYVECANECLTELHRRLTGVFNAQKLQEAA